jgi:mRNA interferase MazF
MRNGKMHKPGDVILTKIQFVDTAEIKRRPALILFSQHNNLVVAGITSNTQMDGIIIEKKDGAIKESVIKTNYIFTISTGMAEKLLFSLTKSKRKEVYDKLSQNIKQILT